MTYSFPYQNAMGSRILSLLSLLVTVGVTLLLRMTLHITGAVLICVLFGLLILTLVLSALLNTKLFLHTGTLRIEGEEAVLKLHNGERRFAPGSVTSVTCEPVRDRRVRSVETFRYWRLTIQAEQKLTLTSDLVVEHNAKSEAAIRDFRLTAEVLRDWAKLPEAQA